MATVRSSSEKQLRGKKRQGARTKRFPPQADQVTVFDSVGFALEDYSALCFVSDAATELGIGNRIELVLQPADPKNLFGLLGSAALASLTSAAAPSQPASAPAQCKQLIINLLLAALLAHPQGSTFVKQQAGQGSRALVLELPGRSFS